jgi:hypothetical protein
MALDRITEFVNHLAAQPDASEGFSAKTFYDTGMTFGLTCREICDNFLGKARALSRGKYPATAPEDPAASRKPTVAKAPKSVKAAAKKAAVKTAKTPKPAKAAKTPKAEPKYIDDAPEGDPAPDDGVVYIATAEELASEA